MTAETCDGKCNTATADATADTNAGVLPHSTLLRVRMTIETCEGKGKGKSKSKGKSRSLRDDNKRTSNSKQQQATATATSGGGENDEDW
jgi:hypothetical protein